MASDRASSDTERRDGSNAPRPPRSSLGRRAGDFDPRTTITTKVLVGVVAAVNAFYLIGDTILNSAC